MKLVRLEIAIGKPAIMTTNAKGAFKPLPKQLLAGAVLPLAAVFPKPKTPAGAQPDGTYTWTVTGGTLDKPNDRSPALTAGSEGTVTLSCTYLPANAGGIVDPVASDEMSIEVLDAPRCTIVDERGNVPPARVSCSVPGASRWQRFQLKVEPADLKVKVISWGNNEPDLGKETLNVSSTLPLGGYRVRGRKPSSVDGITVQCRFLLGDDPLPRSVQQAFTLAQLAIRTPAGFGAPPLITAGQKVELAASYSPLDGEPSYRWSFSGGSRGMELLASDGSPLPSDDAQLSSPTVRFRTKPGVTSLTVTLALADQTVIPPTEHSFRVIASDPAKPDPCGLSGPEWVRRFFKKYNDNDPLDGPGNPHWSQDPSDLSEDFKPKVAAFLEWLGANGIAYSVDSTFRPRERAHLMHYCGLVASGELSPEDANLASWSGNMGSGPSIAPIGIDWCWRTADGTVDVARSQEKARQMRDGYGIAYPASLSSNHFEGNAIDMKIDWSGPKTVYLNSGEQLTLCDCKKGSNKGNGAFCKKLWDVGATFGVIKMADDAPHWSSNGR